MSEQPQDHVSAKLTRLRDRLAAEQRWLILDTASVDMLPTTKALACIARLEGALVAIGELIEQDGGHNP